MKNLLLLGASGLAREVISAAQSDYLISGILDDSIDLHGTDVAGVEVLGGIELAADHNAQLLACVGPSQRRRHVVERLAAAGVGVERFGTLIDASVRIPTSCSVGTGSILLANTVLTTHVTIGRHVVVMPNCTLTHDDVVEDFATLAAGVCLGGGVRVGAASYLGMNSTIRQHLTIGRDTLVGMGAAVLKDIPSGETWVGVPAQRFVSAG